MASEVSFCFLSLFTFLHTIFFRSIFGHQEVVPPGPMYLIEENQRTGHQEDGRGWLWGV